MILFVKCPRTDSDTDKISYALQDNFNDKFQIDAKTGEVRLGKNLDFESKNTYLLNILATDETGLITEKEINLNVTDVNYELMQAIKFLTKTLEKLI